MTVASFHEESGHFEVVLSSSRAVGPNLVAVSLSDLPPGLLNTYQTAGQYVVVDLPDGPLYLSLASEPGLLDFDLLIRTGGGKAADRLAELPVGSRVRVGPAAGVGFPVVTDRSPVWLLAAGSGIAPMRAVIRQRLAAGKDLRGWTLVWGARNDGYRPYLDELPAWKTNGLRLVLADSEPRAGAPRRYVQDALGELPLDVSSTKVLLCGMKPMVAAAREHLATRGLSHEAIHLNY